MAAPAAPDTPLGAKLGGAVDEFAIGDHVVLSKGLPGRNDNVGTVVNVGDDVVWVEWKGPEAPAKPAKYVPRALERA